MGGECLAFGTEPNLQIYAAVNYPASERRGVMEINDRGVSNVVRPALSYTAHIVRWQPLTSLRSIPYRKFSFQPAKTRQDTVYATSGLDLAVRWHTVARNKTRQ